MAPCVAQQHVLAYVVFIESHYIKKSNQECITLMIEVYKNKSCNRPQTIFKDSENKMFWVVPQ